MPNWITVKRKGGGPKQTKKKARTENEEKKTPNLSKEMCILRTGVRDGEFIIGLTKATKNTVMQVFFPEGKMYHPSKMYVEATTDIDFRDKFNNIKFFADQTLEQRKHYISSHIDENAPEHTSSHMGMLNDIPGVEIILYSVGGESIIDDERPNLYDDLIGERISVNDFYARIPGGGKTKYEEVAETESNFARRHSLALRGDIWKVQTTKSNLPTTYYLDLIGGTISSTHPREGQKVSSQRSFQVNLNIPFMNVGIKDNRVEMLEVVDSFTSQTFRRENWKNLKKFNASFANYEEYFDEVYDEIRWFTPAIHKSLLQKLIRTRCTHVRLFYKDKLIPADAVLFVSFVILVTDGGSFVPDISRFVRGCESAFKRIGVALGEDTYSSFEFINAMLGAALASQEYPEFQPTEELVAYAITGSIEAQKDPRAWDYDVKIDLSKKAENLVLSMPFYLLNTLGSFESDIGLLQSIGLHPNKLVKGYEKRRGMEIMPIEYSLDQHSLTIIAHFFPPKNQTYTDVFKHLWVTGTGRNARKTDCAHVTPDVAQAQRQLWLCKTSSKTEIESDNNQAIQLHSNIHWSWMAGMLNKISVSVQDPETKKTIRCQVFVHPDVEGKFVAIQPATREKAAEDLSEDVKDAAIKEAMHLLEKEGKPIKNKWLGIDGTAYFKDVSDEDNTKVFYLNRERWSDVCSKTLNLPAVLPLTETNSSNSFHVMDDVFFTNCCDQVLTHKSSKQGSLIMKWRECLDLIVNSMDAENIARLSMYIRPLNQIIELFKISRDGSATYLDVSWRDTVVFRALIYFCAIAPGVIRIDNSMRFHITDLRVWAIIRNEIFNKLNAGYTPTKWTAKLEDTRELYAHQKAAVEQIQDRFTNSRRGNLIWIPVGLGKTFIVTSVIGWLLKTNRMPKYCIYSGTPSSMTSIIADIEGFGKLPVKKVDYKLSSKDRQLFEPHKINIIEHDQMRIASKHMLSIASECLFIIDEFHLTMNDTKRTSIALEMAKLSWNFIGMTGTLIKDKSSKGVIQWVSQVVDFEVDDKNYWVAIASLVSRKIALPIKQDRVFKEIKMLPDEREKYLNSIEKKFGGNANNTDLKTAGNICYEAVERGIIETALELQHVIRDPNNKDKKVFEPKDSVEYYFECKWRKATIIRRKGNGSYDLINMDFREKMREESFLKDLENKTEDEKDKLKHKLKLTFVQHDVELENPRPIFIVAKGTTMQNNIADALRNRGLRVFCITSKNSIKLTPTDDKLYDAVITTGNHSTGYTLTKADTMITSVYYSNQATRDQLEGRICRVGQDAKVVSTIVLHTGILTYTLKHYEDARTLRMTMEDLAEIVSFEEATKIQNK